VTAGSVDDGKSTLIGRLLYDTDQVYEDQLEAAKRASKVDGEIDFALLTDGLSAEREQGITIDVAYRYFSTAKRRFIIADVPGHEQYTRNMITGASQAHVALLLADARKGLLEQSKRHLFAATLLGIKHIVVVVNKMDMVGYAQETFEDIKQQFLGFAAKLDVHDLQFIPVSSLKGDMIVKRSENMPWYGGRTVLDYLENVEVSASRNLIDFRFPVQYVLRPHQDYRGYAGTVVSGRIKVGDEVKALPSGKTSTVKSIYVGDEKVAYAFNPQAVVIELEDERDISRGDMIVRAKNTPDMSDMLEATLSWFAEDALEIGKRYMLKQTTHETPCVVSNVQYRIDVNTLHRDKGVSSIAFNEVGRVDIQTHEPLLFDAYSKIARTGSFILIDLADNTTVGAGILLKKSGFTKTKDLQKEVVAKKGGVLWFTGLSGSGKSTIADKVFDELHKRGMSAERLDGDVLRSSVAKDLGFSKEDRAQNIRIAGFTAGMLAKHGVLAVSSFISPHKDMREEVRQQVGSFIEIFVDAPLEVCEERDVKGLYKKARAGEIDSFTGVSDVYEAPENPEIHLHTDELSVDECVNIVLDYLRDHGFGG